MQDYFIWEYTSNCGHMTKIMPGYINYVKQVWPFFRPLELFGNICQNYVTEIILNYFNKHYE